MSLSHILGPAEPDEPAAPKASTDVTGQPASTDATSTAIMPPPPAAAQERSEAAQTPRATGPAGEEQASPSEPVYTSTTTSTRRNASGSVSSVYSGNKIRHLKKEDGIPLWRKDIQYDFLNLVFSDKTRCFTKYSDGTKNNTFAEIYIDAMAKSSKTSKILKEKLLQDTDGAVAMAMVCLLVNVGRMNTTLNFFPEMRAQLRTYHSIPALQARQDPNAYKQLQDAPRLKSILKGATEDEPQPNTIEDIKAARIPRTNPVNLIFVLSQFAPKVSEVHFPAPRDFFDLVMRPSLSSRSRATAFLWLIWWYLESDFGYEDSQRNPFGPGLYAEGDKEAGLLPLKVPTLESLNEEQAAAENLDTEDEMHYGEVKRKERIAILASEPSPAMTALKRARKEKGLVTGSHGLHSEDESEAGMSRYHVTSAGRSNYRHDTGSDYTRSPSPAASRGFQAVNVNRPGDMRINNLLNNDDAMSETSPPHRDSGLSRKPPGRSNWRRDKHDLGAGSATQHVRLLPNSNAPLNFVNDAPPPSSYHNIAPSSLMPSPFRDHVPTPSYQAQKRHRGTTQHQSLLQTHRQQQVSYELDSRLRKVHAGARQRREMQSPIVRAWKRVRVLPIDYDSEEERIKLRKAEAIAKVNVEVKNDGAAEELEEVRRRPKLHLAGYALWPYERPSDDVGEEARSLSRALRRAMRRLDRWQDPNQYPYPGQAMIRRRQQRHEQRLVPARAVPRKEVSMDQEVYGARRSALRRQRSSTGRVSEQGMVPEPDDEDGGAELDEEDRELLGEVDADESEDDEEMDDD